MHSQFAGICSLASAVTVRAILPERENAGVDLSRVGWLTTVFGCLIAVIILLLQGYYGYAVVTLAVAVSAAINLV